MHSTHEQVVEVPRAGFAALHARWRTLQDALDTALMAVGAVLMLAMMLLVVADVSLRYLFNAPLVWSYEVISSYLMPAVFFLAVSHTLKVHGHVAVDLLHQRMGRRLRYAVHAVLAVLAAPVFAWAAFAAAQRTWAEFAAGDVSTSGLGVPSWSVSVLLPLGFGLLALRLLLDAAGFAGTLLTGRAWVGLPPLSGVDEGRVP
jgi:TRAP-type C4-dicarboxylate transport system permease small subunit